MRLRDREGNMRDKIEKIIREVAAGTHHIHENPPGGPRKKKLPLLDYVEQDTKEGTLI